MVNVVSTLATLFYNGWEILDPDVGGVRFCTQDYGHDTDLKQFDANAVSPQVAIKEESRMVDHVAGSKFKRLGRVSVMVYLKPTNYQPATITAAEATFSNMIEEINGTIEASKYTVTNINEIKMVTPWVFKTNKRGEPIIFEAETVLEVSYYE